MARIRLKSYEFRRERERSWRKLDQLVTQAEQHGVGSLRGKDLMTLPRLYRGALSSLNVARAISLDKNVLEYLEALSQRAYFTVYGVRRHLREVLATFFARAFPATVRQLRWNVLLAGVTLMIGTFAGYEITRRDSDRFYAFVSPEMASGRDPDTSTESLRGALYSTDHTQDGLGLFASFLFTHNAKVGMLCFALGFVAGIPVFLLLLTNGLALGAFWAVYAERGLGTEFWAWLSPHGVTELLAVVLCSAAGLALARSLVFPGRLPRLASLAQAGRKAGVIVLGAVVMFFVAGLIEGIFRQTVHDVPTRYALATLTAVFWVWYLGFVGRDRRAA